MLADVEVVLAYHGWLCPWASCEWCCLRQQAFVSQEHHRMESVSLELNDAARLARQPSVAEGTHNKGGKEVWSEGEEAIAHHCCQSCRSSVCLSAQQCELRSTSGATLEIRREQQGSPQEEASASTRKAEVSGKQKPKRPHLARSLKQTRLSDRPPNFATAHKVFKPVL